MTGLAQVDTVLRRALLATIACVCASLVACSDSGHASASVPSDFRVYIEGDAIMLAARSGRTPSHHYCSGAVSVQKRSGSKWVPLRDDRPHSSQAISYYLDGSFVLQNPGWCDVDGCGPFHGAMLAGRTEEYVKTGTKAPPANTPLVTATQVDVIESRPFHGAARVAFEYAPTCGRTAEAFLPLTVPEHGVCCPVVARKCSENGLRGGWAPTRKDCATTGTYPDIYFRFGDTDGHGCPITCCGCMNDQDVSDEDAGI